MLHLLTKYFGMMGFVNTSNIKKILFFFVYISLALSCDDTTDYYVPDVPVNIELNLRNELSPLGVGGAVLVVPDSSNEDFAKVIYPDKKIKIFEIPWKVYGTGIIIYRADLNLYLAYDRTCTYKAFTDHCGIVFKDNYLLPECPCCGSKFMITANAVSTSSSKAERPLLQLQTTMTDNNSRLIVSKAY